jgi:hypothetical protein
MARQIKCILRHSITQDDGQTIIYAPAGTPAVIIGFSTDRKLIDVYLENAWVDDLDPNAAEPEDRNDCGRVVIGVTALVGPDDLVFAEIII